MKMKKQETKSRVMSYLLLALALVIVLGVVGILSGFVGHDKKPDTEWLYENCVCLENERISCQDGFELKEGICWKENKFTSVLKSCSKYDCDGEIVKVK